MQFFFPISFYFHAAIKHWEGHFILKEAPLESALEHASAATHRSAQQEDDELLPSVGQFLVFLSGKMPASESLAPSVGGVVVVVVVVELNGEVRQCDTALRFSCAIRHLAGSRRHAG